MISGKIRELVPKMVELHRRPADLHALVNFHPDILRHATTVAVACGINTKSPIALAPASHTTMDQKSSEQGSELHQALRGI